MNMLFALFWADLVGLTRWFAKMSLSRIVVAVLFLLLFGGIAWALWGMGNVFFRALATFEQYGQLTAGYLIHAAIVMILWLALGSSLTASVGMLALPNRSLSWLLSLPLPPASLAVWLYVKSILANFLLMAFAFVPIALSYAAAFEVASVGFLLRTLLVLVCIVLVSSGIGMLVALSLTSWLRGREYPMAIIGLAAFFAVMVGLLRLVFPPTLGQLYEATSTQFWEMFPRLPLNHPGLPTGWLTQTVTTGASVETVLALLLTAAVVLVTLAVQTRRLVPVVLSLRSAPFMDKVSAAWQQRFLRFRFPLLLKDWLSLVRLPSETGYGLFLFSVAVFFFLFLSFGVGRELRQDVWRVQLVQFSFGWLVFFATAFFLRFSFPLVAREARSSWYLFGLPWGRVRILLSKVLLSLLLSLPVSLFVLLVWWQLPFAAGYRRVLVGVSWMVVFLLSLCQVLLGAIFPNFSAGDDAEKVSTSGMGLFTLGVSAAIAAGAAALIGQIVTGRLSPLVAIFIILQLEILLVGILWFAATAAVRRYEW